MASSIESSHRNSEYQQVLRRRTSSFHDDLGQPTSQSYREQQQNLNSFFSDVSEDRRSSFSFWNLFSPNWYLSIVWNFVHSATFATVFIILLLWASIFIYITFYFLYIPSLDLSKTIHFDFDSDCSSDKCGNPKAIIPLTEYRNPTLFAKGQQYRIRVDLTMPDSEVNSKQGMFMVKLRMFDANSKEITTTKRPSMLKYKSLVVRLIHIFFNWPFYVVGFSREDEKLQVPMIEEYVDGTRSKTGPANTAEIELIARDVQVYESTLVIQANLTGLRFYMVNWPIITALFGIATIFAFLSLVIIFNINRVTKDESSSTQMLYGDLDDTSSGQTSQVYHSLQPASTGEFHSIPTNEETENKVEVMNVDESPDSTSEIE